MPGMSNNANLMNVEDDESSSLPPSHLAFPFDYGGADVSPDVSPDVVAEEENVLVAEASPPPLALNGTHSVLLRQDKSLPVELYVCHGKQDLGWLDGLAFIRTNQYAEVFKSMCHFAEVLGHPKTYRLLTTNLTRDMSRLASSQLQQIRARIPAPRGCPKSLPTIPSSDDCVAVRCAP